MGRILDLYCRAIKFIIALCLAVMVVLVFGNVVLRYVFNSGITVSEELSRWLMVWLTFLGAIVALREHSHLGVDTLVRALPPAGKRICFAAQLRPDALCRLAAARRELEADADHRRRSRAGDQSLCRHLFLRRRRRVRRLRRRRSCSTISGACSAARRPKRISSRSANPKNCSRAHDDRGLHAVAARRHGARHADRLRADRLRRRADGSARYFRLADRRAEHHQRRRQLSR